MTVAPCTARRLLRQAAGLRTLYLVRRPTRPEPEITLDIPCGQTLAVALGRWPLDALPTDDELAEDIRRALAAMRRVGDRDQPPKAMGARV